jgi:hypothetical protein
MEWKKVRNIEQWLQIVSVLALHGEDNTRQWTYFDDVTCKQVGAIFGRRGYVA